MSLETELHKLTEAILTLASATVASSPPAEAALTTLAPAVPATPGLVPATPVPAAATPAAATPAMPPPPALVPATPAALVADATVPFTDAKGLVDWVMGKYKELGPTNGALIQNVLVGLGYQNINEVKPEHYPALVKGVGEIPTTPVTP